MPAQGLGIDLEVRSAVVLAHPETRHGADQPPLGDGGGGGGVAFVKYSPFGWVVSVSGRSARLPTPSARHRPAVEAA